MAEGSVAKDELYRLWQIQESLHQYYRALGLSSQGFMFGLTLVLTTNVNNEVRKAGFLQSYDYVLLTMTVIVIVIGFHSLYRFREAVQRRGRIIHMLQNLILVEENPASLKALKDNFYLGAIKILEMGLTLKDRDKHKYLSYISEEDWQYFIDRSVSAGEMDIKKDRTRNFLGSTLWSYLFALWFVASAYVALIVVRQFVL